MNLITRSDTVLRITPDGDHVRMHFTDGGSLLISPSCQFPRGVTAFSDLEGKRVSHTVNYTNMIVRVELA
jgi:hypothetical protein